MVKIQIEENKADSAVILATEKRISKNSQSEFWNRKTENDHYICGQSILLALIATPS